VRRVSIGPEKWPIFGRFLTLFDISIKTSRMARKNTSNMAATIGDVMDDVTCKSSILYQDRKIHQMPFSNHSEEM
jgi:hypothetical protein